MADYITRILTKDGEKQIDYNALANKPEIQWRKLGELSIEADSGVYRATLSQDEDGNPLSLTKVRIDITELTPSVSYFNFFINGVGLGDIRQKNVPLTILVEQVGLEWEMFYIQGSGQASASSVLTGGMNYAGLKRLVADHPKITSVTIDYITALKCVVYGA